MHIYKYINICIICLWNCIITTYCTNCSNNLYLSFTGEIVSKKIVIYTRLKEYLYLVFNAKGSPADSLFENEILSRLNFPTNRTPVSKMMGFALSSPVKNPIYCSPPPYLVDNCIQQGSVLRGYVCAVLYADRETETFRPNTTFLLAIRTLVNLPKCLNIREKRDGSLATEAISPLSFCFSFCLSARW